MQSKRKCCDMLKTITLQQGDFLKKNPFLLHFYYLKQNIPDGILYVDEENENVAFYYAKEKEASVFCNDEKFMQDFFDLLPKGETHFQATNPFARDWLKKRCEFIWASDCNFFCYNGQPLPKPQHETGSLTSQHVNLVATGTSYQADLEEIAQAIETRPTCAIYVDQNPVCWCVTHTDYSMGMLYTLPNHRHKGYALSVMLDIANKLIKSGVTPFCYIIEGNVASENLAKKYNMESLDKSFYFGIEKL